MKRRMNQPQCKVFEYGYILVCRKIVLFKLWETAECLSNAFPEILRQILWDEMTMTSKYQRLDNCYYWPMSDPRVQWCEKITGQGWLSVSVQGDNDCCHPKHSGVADG